MPYGVGIDLGTTFTSAAVSGPGGTRMVPLSPEVIVPSLAYAAPDGSLVTGLDAVKQLGDTDRIARDFKRRLGDPTPLLLGGSAYSPAALMAAQLHDVLATVTRAEGGPPASVVLTCPAIWGPYRRETFAEVPRLANVRDYQLITEPEAAATHYSVERRLGDGEVVAVYDLGGGTFDTTILRMSSGGMEILGTPEGIEHMGGIDFDEALMAHIDIRLGGAISELDPADPEAATALAEIRAMCVRAKEELSVEPDVRLAVPLPGGPREVTVTRLELNDLIRPSVQLTADALRRTVASAHLHPDDLSAVLLAGGSSRIPLVTQLISKEFGKPVRVTLHPKFTVALGAGAIAGRAALAPRPVASSERIPEPRGASPQADAIPSTTMSRRRKRLLPTIAAAVAVAVAAVVTTLILSSGSGSQPNGLRAGAANTSSTGPLPPPPTLRLYDGDVIPPYHSLVASPENWTGTEFGAAGGHQTPISAAPDQAKGLRVTWTGDAPAQIYLQSSHIQYNLKSYVDSNGALVFDVTVHHPPTSSSLAADCLYPCRGAVNATNLFQGLPKDTKATVKIPLSCFTGAGLDATKVDTPFLVYADGAFDATFSDIRWQPGAATASDAETCADLK
jgi:actin-like ATPase involved in cell morphogenesis